MKKHFIFPFFAIFFAFSISVSQIPRTLSHQGYLTNHSGTALDTTVSMIFDLFSDSVGGSSLWQQNFPGVQIIKGMYNVNLGPVNLPFDAQYWLGIQVGGETITPRTKLTSSAYSLRADTANSLSSNSAISVASLDVKGGINVAGNITASDYSGPNNNIELKGLGSGGVWINSDRGTGGFRVFDGSSGELFRITSLGRVAIGTTTPDIHSRLHVKLPGTGNLDNMTIESPGTGVGFGLKFVQPNRTWLIGQNIGNYNDARFQIYDLSGGDRMTFLTNGYVGIGTSNPLKKVDIDYGDLMVQGPQSFVASGDTASVYFGDNYHYLRAVYGGLAELKGLYGIRFLYGTSPTEAMRINNNGYLGIGTTNPYYALDVRKDESYFTTHISNQNTGSAYGLLAEANNSSSLAGSSRYGIRANAWYGTNNNYGGYFYGWGGNYAYGVFALASGAAYSSYAGYFSGDVMVTGTFYNPSDIKLKENIQPLTGVLNKISQIESKTFNYKSSSEFSKMNLPKGKRYGFLAQDLEKIFPELVADQVQFLDDGEPGKETGAAISYKGINYISMIPILVEAIKEQQSLINKQQLKIEELENKITKTSK